jgi:hypothetical protein
METLRRTPLAEHPGHVQTAAQTVRAATSKVQWLFNPFSDADTTNWHVSTGVGKLNIGGLTKVANITTKDTPNKTQKTDRGVRYGSTADFDGKYVENERYALFIANEITNSFPRRVHRIKALEGIEDDAQVDMIQNLLLGETLPVSYIEGVSDPVPVLTQMLEVLRYNMREISKTNSPQKALLLAVGKEFESALADNIKLAIDDLKMPQQEVAQGKRAGFDVNAKRNFLAVGRPVPEVKLTTGATMEVQNRPVDDRLLKALDKLNNLLDGEGTIQGEPDETTARMKDEELPEGFLNETDANVILATTSGSEVSMEFEDHPKIVETKPLTNKQTEAADKKEEAKAEKIQAEEAKTAEKEEQGIRRCAAITGSGTQCTKDAVQGSRFCSIKSHQEQG